MPNPSTLLKTGAIVGDRYQILKQLGCGGFGCTYLAEDTLESSEKCILKEFASPLENRHQFFQAEEFFEREAGILKMLRHPQIPKFKELLRLEIEGEESLFLVQDYIEGLTYGELVQQGKCFNEAEVTQLLLNLLPVLEYIHSLNLVHRDISPDNLIQNPEGKPVLINFGCVKVAANALLGTVGKPVILVGKPGYALEEQLLYGQVLPESDLYALAVTVLVLMTGEPPQTLHDGDNALWNWEQVIAGNAPIRRGTDDSVTLSPTLAEVLAKMLAHQPGDRYRSARKVRKILENQTASTRQTDTVEKNKELQTSSLLTDQKLKGRGSWKPTLIRACAVAIPAAIAFTGIQHINWQDSPNRFSFNEQTKQQQIYQRIKKLGINEGVFYEQVDRLFYARYPALQGTQLSERPEHQSFRQAWYQIADNLLETLEKQ